jgi:hypothetical protein
VDKWIIKYNKACKTWYKETRITGLHKIIKDIKLKHDRGRSISSNRRYSSALTQGNPLYTRHNQRAARLINNHKIPDLKEKFHQDPLMVQISNKTVINCYKTRETQTKTPLESNIKDNKPCSCKLACATC